jgi:hypothetical protein
MDAARTADKYIAADGGAPNPSQPPQAVPSSRKPRRKRAAKAAKPLLVELRELLDAVPAAAAANASGPDGGPLERRWQRMQDRFFLLLGKLCQQVRFTVPELAVLALAQWRLDDGWADAHGDIRAALLRGLCGIDPEADAGGVI